MALTSPVEPDEWRPPSWRTRLYALGAAAILFGVLGLTGGLDRVPPPPAGLATVAVNERFDAGPWTSKVTNAAATTDLGSAYKPRTEGNWLLAVAVEVELTQYSGDSLGAAYLDNIVSLRGVKGVVGKGPLYVALVRDGSTLDYLNPGLPERIAYMFEMEKSAPVPDRAVVVLRGRDVYWSWTERGYTWDPLVDKAEVTVDVANRLAAA